MTIRVSGTTITFNDGTTQSTAGSTPTTLYAVGTYVIGRPQNTTNYTVNSTIAGSSLYATSVKGRYFGYSYCGGPFWDGNGGQTLINTGTWRCMSPAYGEGGGNSGTSGLWVRIS